MMDLTISPIAVFRSPLGDKFGIPRQSGVVEELRGRIVFAPEWRNDDAIRGIEGFDYLWLIWSFSKNVEAAKHALVRPPRLGGNEYMGVFATRSSFRPNNLALSSVRIVGIERLPDLGTTILVSGADLMDGTPIYDIKPYIPAYDSHPEARGGFTDSHEWHALEVVDPSSLLAVFPASDAAAIRGLLAQDPRPSYHKDPNRIYGMPYGTYDIRFTVSKGVVTITAVIPLGK